MHETIKINLNFKTKLSFYPARVPVHNVFKNLIRTWSKSRKIAAFFIFNLFSLSPIKLCVCVYVDDAEMPDVKKLVRVLRYIFMGNVNLSFVAAILFEPCVQWKQKLVLFVSDCFLPLGEWERSAWKIRDYW